MFTTAHDPFDDRIFYKESWSLARNGAEVLIIHPKKNGLNDFSSKRNIKFLGYKMGRDFPSRLSHIFSLSKFISELDCEVIHVHEPDALLIAILSRKGNVKIIYDSHELWGGVFAGKFPETFWSFSQRLFQFIESEMISKVDGAIGATWGITEYLENFLSPEKVVTILNVPNTEIFGIPGKIYRKLGKEVVICHEGHLNFDRGFKIIVETMKILSDEFDNVYLKIVGDIKNTEKKWVSKLLSNSKYNWLRMTGWVPYEKVGQELRNCHIGLITFPPHPNHFISAPNKLFNYLLYGIPFVAPDYEKSGMRKVALEDECGILVKEYSSSGFASAISRFLNGEVDYTIMSRNAIKASQEKYRWEHMEVKLIDFYKKVLDS